MVGTRSSTLGIMHRSRSYSLLLAAFALSAAPFATIGHAQTLTTLYSFTGSPTDGAYPDGNVIFGASGVIYGTTYLGGTGRAGTVFEMIPAGGGTYSETIIYNFTGGADGGEPGAGLIMGPDGSLFGTAEFSDGASPKGTVFRLFPPSSGGSWTFETIYAFSGGTDGGAPNCDLKFDGAGNVWGTTTLGGAYGVGVVFRLTPPTSGPAKWTETVMHSFDGTDGARPLDGLAADSSGNFYGTTGGGGTSDDGTVFKMTKSGSSYTFSSLHSFSGADGKTPYATPFVAANGYLYGTAAYGGTGYGTAWELQPPTGSGTTYTESTIFRFNGSNGSNPSAPLISNGSTGFYGNTMGVITGQGNVFELTPPTGSGTLWSDTVLYTFGTATGDGTSPISSLVLNGGALYSITYYGGTVNAGTVFRLTP